MATKTKAKTVTKTKGKTKKVGTCLMTGNPTAGGNFCPGMDARLKGALIKVTRGEASLNSIPKAAITRMRENGSEGLVGFRLNGDKLVKIGNFNIAANGKAAKGAKAKKELSAKSAFKSGGSAKARRKAEAAKKLAKRAEAATASADESDEDEGSDEEE